ncbi:MAG: glutamyl-tRNA reductase [Gammaproteobacteria bacterium]
MALLVVGINHKTAPIAIRERLHVGADSLPQALYALRRSAGIKEALILSTCNRTEVYCHQEPLDSEQPMRWLTQHHGLHPNEVKPYSFSYPQEETVRHLLRVACGLDSMVLGEPQILGQIKQAYRVAFQQGTLGKLLHRLFQHAFAVAKRVRTDTAIGSSPVSVAFAAARLAQQVFGGFEQHTAMLIGAGDTIDLVAHHLHERRLQRLIIVNRSLERSQRLAARFAGYAIPLRDLAQHLAEADLVVSATASPVPILSQPVLAQAMRGRRHRPILLLDLAVPRDIDPACASLPDVYYYTIDDLEAVIGANLASRQNAALQADEIISVQVREFMDWVQSLDAVATIRGLRARAEQARERALQNARHRLALGADPALVIEELAHALTNKLIHAPSAKLRASSRTRREELADAARELFELDAEATCSGDEMQAPFCARR